MNPQATETPEAEIATFAWLIDLHDELERVHVKLGLMEYHAVSTERIGSGRTERLRELCEYVKGIIGQVEGAIDSGRLAKQELPIN